MMNRTIVAVAVTMIMATTAINIHATDRSSADQNEYTRAQIRQMIRDASTREQCEDLADYFGRRQRMFEGKAGEEMHLWATRATMSNALSEKWPRPVDSSRNRYEYYEYEANRAATLKAKYLQLAEERRAK